MVVLRFGGYVSKNLTTRRLLVVKGMQGGSVSVVHIERLCMFVVLRNLWRFSSLDCVLANDRKALEKMQKEVVLT
jgi:hypothetical protein